MFGFLGKFPTLGVHSFADCDWEEIMRIPEKKIIGVVLLIAVLMISSHAPAQEQHQVDQTSGAKSALSTPAPNLSEIIPLAAELSGRLSILENKVSGLLDVHAFEKKYAGIDENLKDPAGQLQRMKESKQYRFNKILELRETIEQYNELLEKTSKPLSTEIRRLSTLRNEWLTEKKRWRDWQSSLREEGAFDQIESTFAKAKGAIDTALDLLFSQLVAMLRVQEKAGNIQAKIKVLEAEISTLILVKRRGIIIDASPLMFSSRYFSQFSIELWYAWQQSLDEISWPDSRFFARQGWIVLLQGFLSLIVIISIYRNRQALYDSKRRRFLAVRPFSAGLFFCTIVAVLFFEYRGVPDTWAFVNAFIGGISFARIVGVLNEHSWKRHFVYGLTTVLIVTKIMEVTSIPLPLFRIYIVLTAVVGILFCIRWAGESQRLKESNLYSWSLWLVSFFLAFIIITEILGKEGLAEYLFKSLIGTMVTVLAFMLLMFMISGILEWLFRSSPLRRAIALYQDTDAIIRRVGRFINVAMWGLIVLPIILAFWGVYDDLQGAMKGLLTFGFNLGSQRISVGVVIISTGILYGSFLASWIVQKLVIDEVLIRRRVETGVRLSVGRLFHYVLIFAGFLLALSILGFDVTKLTIMLSALGVGIGFGLQSVVNNFVSGLILLFERPVRVGDYIEIGGDWAEIKRIGLRSATVQTFDQADLIIPNADLVTNPVTNWTLSNRQIRLKIPIGVAYGSDIPLVMETLMNCAKANSRVAETPAPQVLFLKFGESALEFELRVFAANADYMMVVRSELHQEIDRSFREAKIEIAFPQRDLHLRSMDESVILQPQETAK